MRKAQRCYRSSEMPRSLRHMLISLVVVALLLSGPHAVRSPPPLKLRPHRANRHAGWPDDEEKPAARRRIIAARRTG